MTTTPITLQDIQTRDITADEIKTMVDAYETIKTGPIQDIAGLDNKTVYDKFWYFIHAFSRLQIPGVDPTKIVVRLGLRVLDGKKYAVELKFNDGETTVMDVLWSGKHVEVKSTLGIAAQGSWRDEVRPIFKTLKTVKNAQKAESKKTEKVLKKAATPKKTKKSPTAKDVEKTVSEKKAPKKPSKDEEKDVLAQVDAIMDGKPLDELDEMIANGEPVPF